MQRFKDFTKKSGKVASAILSAAMVTSMVAGTNVVYAATETTEATTDVTGQTTIQSDQEAVRAAKADLEAALKDLPVTSGLTEDDVDVLEALYDADFDETDDDFDNDDNGYKHKALKDFYKPAYDIMDQYNVKIDLEKIDYKAATLTKTGTVTVTFEITRKNDKETAKIEYTTASLTDRQKAAEAAVTKALDEYKTKVNNTTTKEDLEKVAKDALGAKGGKYESIPLYEDFDVDGTVAKLLDKDLAELNKKGSLEAEVTVKQKEAKTGTVLDNAAAHVVFTTDTPSNQERMDAAMTAAKDYLKDARYLNADLNTDKGEKFAEGLQAYLANPTVGFDDIKVNMAKTDSDGNAVDKFTVDNHATQNEDGKATVTFTLDTTDDYFTDTNGAEVDIPAEQKASATAENVSLVLASDETTAKKALADLKAAAEKVDVEALDDGDIYGGDYIAEYNAKFLENLNNDLKAYRLDAAAVSGSAITTGSALDFENDEDGTPVDGKGFDTKPNKDKSPMTLKDFNNIYSNLTEATVAFTAKDASAGKDGKPKTELFVSIATQGQTNAGFAQKETQTATVDYTIDSAQTVVDKAAAAVQAALDAMNVTNDTTDADVMKVVEDALKDYSGVSAKVVKFDKHDATADKEGTAEIVVELTDKKNGITKEAKANKKFAFYCNTFVEKDGKKYYYGKDGKLATTDKGYFLQGTDSPDGYTYFIQNDGSVMQDRITYHPDGEHVIYFDKDGHEVFDAFVNVKKDALGQDVDYIGYFDTFGYAYVNKTTYGNGEGAYAKDALFYINDYGVLENKGWFGNAAGEIGYAAPNGTLTTSQWSLDQFGRKVYFQANGFLAKGLMTDGVKYYQLDENDGHLVGEF